MPGNITFPLKRRKLEFREIRKIKFKLVILNKIWQIFSESALSIMQMYGEGKNRLKTWGEPERQSKIGLEFVRALIFSSFFSPHRFFPPPLVSNRIVHLYRNLEQYLLLQVDIIPSLDPNEHWYWSNGLHCKLESRETGSFLDTMIME